MPQTRFIFNSWLDQYQLVHHLILYSNILMVLQGKKGSGKTAYIDGLLEKLPNEFICQTLKPDELSSVDYVSLQLRQLFSLSTIHADSKPTNIELVAQIVERKKHCLLIIDDAENLSNEVVGELLTCLQSQQEEVYFHCLMVGEPSLANKFDLPPFLGCKESFTHIFDIPDLSVAETKAYLKYKFSSLGIVNISKLSDEQVASMLIKANRNLAKLTELAKEELTLAAEKVTDTKRISLPFNLPLKKASIFGGVIFAALFITLVWRSPAKQTMQTKSLSLPKQMKQVSANVNTHSTPTADLKFKQRAAIAETVNLTDKKMPTKSKAGYVPLSMIPKYDLLSEKQKKQATSTKEPPLERQISALKADRQRRAQPAVAVIDSVLATPKPQQAVEKITASRASIASKPQKIVSNSKPTLKLKGQQRRGKGYGIQLIASNELAAVKRYASEYGIEQQARYYQTHVKGKKWYVLVVGDHTTKAQAQKAVTKLPKSLQVKRPWIRTIKGLKRVD